MTLRNCRHCSPLTFLPRRNFALPLAKLMIIGASKLLTAAGHAVDSGTNASSAGPAGSSHSSSNSSRVHNTLTVVPVIFVLLVATISLALGWWVLRRLRARRSGWQGFSAQRDLERPPRLFEVARRPSGPCEAAEQVALGAWGALAVSKFFALCLRSACFCIVDKGADDRRPSPSPSSLHLAWHATGGRDTARALNSFAPMMARMRTSTAARSALHTARRLHGSPGQRVLAILRNTPEPAAASTTSYTGILARRRVNICQTAMAKEMKWVG